MRWRDRLGRWASPRRPRQDDPPMPAVSENDIAAIASLPAETLSRLETSLRRAPEPADDVKPEPALSPPANPFAPLLEAARSIGQRIERLETGNREIERLEADGWTAEGVSALLDFKQQNGIVDTKRAIAEFERANPRPEPVTSSRAAHWRHLASPDAMDERVVKAAYEHLLEGDDETWLKLTVPMALKAARGQ